LQVEPEFIVVPGEPDIPTCVGVTAKAFGLVNVQDTPDGPVTVNNCSTACTVKLAEAVLVVPAALVAVTVQEPVPVLEVLTEIVPDVPEPEPLAGAAQLTDAEDAPEVDQLKDELLPVDTLVGLNEAPVTDGAATTDKVSDPVSVVPAAFVAVTVHVPVPVPLVLAVKLPLRLLELPLVVPVQATLTEVAPVVAQLNVLDVPVVA
jgi:hypothetical protein